MPKLNLLICLATLLVPIYGGATSPIPETCELLAERVELTPPSECFSVELLAGMSACDESPLAMFVNGCEASLYLTQSEFMDCSVEACPFEGFEVTAGESLVLAIGFKQAQWSEEQDYTESWTVGVKASDLEHVIHLSYRYRHVPNSESPSNGSLFGCQQVGGEAAALWVMLMSMALIIDRRLKRRRR